MHGLKVAGIELDHKALADVAYQNQPEGFANLTKPKKTQIANKAAA